MTTDVTRLELAHFRLGIDDAGVVTALIDRAGEEMNTLSPDLALEVGDIIEHCDGDPNVRALVIGSAKPSNFLAGADVRWLRGLDDAADASTLLRRAHGVFARLEAMHREGRKPVVAAIHGACLGGGLELALACGIRIASDDEAATKLGQPEVRLGLIPGGGGTQRLPRLVGIATGLDLILSGRSIGPRRARKIGLVDEVCPKEVLLDVARGRAAEAIGRDATPAGNATSRVKAWLSPQALQQLVLEDNVVGRKVLFSKAQDRLLAATKGNYPAPEGALRAVKVGVEQGIAAGYEAELEEFGHLVVSAQAKALMSVFFATRELRKDRGIEGEAAVTPISHVGVVGGGLMGGGIAAVNTYRAGVTTRIKEIDHAGVGRALGYVGKVLDHMVRRRRLARAKADRLARYVTGTTDWSGFGSADLVIEAVFEDLELKRSILRDVEAATADRTIFASNTSSIPIAAIAAAASRPEQVIGMHYFSPVEKMPLLEVVVTPDTADWVTATCMEFGRRQGKTVVVVNDGAGFYTTRALAPYSSEAGYLLAEGVSIEAIDAAMVDWGFPVGPITLIDEVGIDVGTKIAKVMTDAFGERLAGPEIFGPLLEDDRLGRKNGRGFYLYESGDRGGVDPTVYKVMGVHPGDPLTPGEIQDRLILHLVNETARCLEEGILRSARDGDIAAIFGFGFPPFTGGPLSWVDQQGAATVVARLERLVDRHGDRYAPASILQEHAKTGEKLRA